MTLRRSLSNHTEILEHLIQRKGDCYLAYSCTSCPFNCRGLLQTVLSIDLNSIIYKKAVELYVELYGEEKLLEILL